MKKKKKTYFKCPGELATEEDVVIWAYLWGY
jgi:hypothetical protein